MRPQFQTLYGAAIGLGIIVVSSCGPNSAGPVGDGGDTDALGDGGFAFPDTFQNGGGCEIRTCAQLGWACGTAVDRCGNIINCADEGLVCGAGETCVGGNDSPTQCVVGDGESCELCPAVPTCAVADGPTRLAGRVITPGRNDEDVANQVGVPNAVVYILRSSDAASLPAISSGIPADGMSCDRCEDQDLGPVLAGAVTDPAGNFVIEGHVPVGVEFLLVVKAGKFRRAVKYMLPATADCETTTLPTGLPGNPTRLPRNMDDGLAGTVNIPHVAVATGAIDGIECVFRKMGLSEDQFSRPNLDGRIHLYRANGAWPDQQSANCDDCSSQSCRMNNCGGASSQARTTYLNALNANRIHENDGRIYDYDMIVFDCEASHRGYSGNGANRRNIRQYANRGGRIFSSHHTAYWIDSDPSGFQQDYDPDNPFITGFNLAGTWQSSGSNINLGTGHIAVGRPNASPRIENFAAWMVSEGVTAAPSYTFDIVEPRSRSTGLGPASEEFVHCQGGPDCTGNNARTQQFSFNTPYGAPAAAACGRVAYSGFHVVAVGGGNNSPYEDVVFPNHCTGNNGHLTNQEKVLLYMLFDLGACVGVPPLPMCVPRTCANVGVTCGLTPDGCGNVLDCGPCVIE